MIENTFFTENIKVGNKGEAIASSFLSSIGYKVENVTKDPKYQKKDIDLIATLGDQVMTIEVKADNYMNRTKNVCVELVSNMETGRKGWIYYCEASHLCFVDLVSRVCYFVRFEEFLNMFDQKEHAFQHKIRYQREDGVYLKQAELVLVPIEELKKLRHYVEGRIM